MHSIQYKPKQTQGFTLIELIVTIALLSILSGIGYQLLRSATQTKQMVNERSETLREFELGLFLLKTDLLQIQVRPLPTNSKAFVGYPTGDKKDGAEDEQVLFMFFHSPETMPLMDIVQTRYVYQDNSLIQEKWIDEDTYATPILKNINAIHIDYLNDNGEISNAWDSTDTLPTQINIYLKHQRFGDLTLQYRLAL